MPIRDGLEIVVKYEDFLSLVRNVRTLCVTMQKFLCSGKGIGFEVVNNAPTCANPHILGKFR